MDNISFQGSSNLVFNMAEYSRLQHYAAKAQKHITDEVTRKVPRWNLYSFETEADQIAVYVGNKQGGFLNILNINKDNSQMLENISSQVNKLLKDAKENLTAWIIGGNKVNSEHGNNLVKTVNEVAEIICDRPDIDTSILAGSKRSTESVALHQAGSTLDVTINNNIETISERDLSEHFDIVELNNII